MESLTAVRNAEVVERFERGEVGENGFHHLDHVRAAYAYVCEMPLLQAIERFSCALKRFAAAQGKTGLYHETITWAYLVLIQERRLRMGDAGEWEHFANANPDLLRWQDGVLARYYKAATLHSELARRAFVLPDGS